MKLKGIELKGTYKVRYCATRFVYMKKAMRFIEVVTTIGINGNMMKKAMRFTLKIVKAIGLKGI